MWILIFILINCPVWSQEVLDIKQDRQLFLDGYIIHQLSGLELELHQPIDQGPIMYFDKPWEGPFSAYCTVIKDSTRYRMYYRGLPTAGSDGSDREVTCYAESTDGLHWIKPTLDLFEVPGSGENNVILAHASPVTHNFSPFLDRNPLRENSEKFKALGGTRKSGLIAYCSADGIHWQRIQDSAVFSDGIFDSQNVSFWSDSENTYVCYFRTWTEDGYSGFRSVGRTTSKDFIQWSTPQSMIFGDTPFEHLYTQQTSPYFRAPQIYVAVGARFMPNRQVLTKDQAALINVNPKYYQDCSDAYIMTTRGGAHYDRTFMESFIRPGIGLENWVSRSNYPALNIVPLDETQMGIYVNADYAQPTAHIKLYTLRTDGFSSLSGSYEIGEMITKPFIFFGSQLEINFATSAAGFIKFELQDLEGHALTGFQLKEATEVIGNEIKRIVQWSSGKELSDLSGKPVRMRIQMKDADLYSFRFF